MRFLKFGYVDFLVWVLLYDGLHADPFHLHPARVGELQQQFGFTEQLWFEWLDYVLTIEGRKVEREIPLDLYPNSNEFVPTPEKPLPTFTDNANLLDFFWTNKPLYDALHRLYQESLIWRLGKPMRYKQFDFWTEDEIPSNDADLIFVDYPGFVWWKSEYGKVIVSIPITSQEEQKERLIEITQNL